MERKSGLTFTTKRLQTKDLIFDGRLTVESGLLVDSCVENENLIEPGCNGEQDTHVICDNNSTPSPNMSCRNLKILILLQTLTTTRATMMNFTNFVQSPQ